MANATSVRLQDQALAELDGKAEREGSSRNALIERAVEQMLHPTPGQGIDCLIELSKSQIACMDQLAERSRLTRKQWIEKVIGAKLRSEFVFERQAQLADLAHP